MFKLCFVDYSRIHKKTKQIHVRLFLADPHFRCPGPPIPFVCILFVSFVSSCTPQNRLFEMENKKKRDDALFGDIHLSLFSIHGPPPALSICVEVTNC